MRASGRPTPRACYGTAELCSRAADMPPRASMVEDLAGGSMLLAPPAETLFFGVAKDQASSLEA